MKKKLFSGLLIACLLLGIIALPAQANTFFGNGDSLYDPILLQDLTGPRYENMDGLLWDSGLLYYYRNGKGGIMDPYGRSISAPAFERYYSLGEGYMGVVQNNKGALFYNARQLTPFQYVLIERMKFCFRAKIDGGYAFLDESGKEISVPSVGDSDWIVSDIIPNKAILMYKEGYSRYDEFFGLITYNPRYQVLDWTGCPISEDTDRKIAFKDENSFTITSYSEEVLMFLDGTTATVLTGHYWVMWDQRYSGTQYTIVSDDEDTGDVYYLTDADYNLICKLETSTKTDSPVISLSNELFMVRTPEDDSIIMNGQGEVVAHLPGSFVTYINVRKHSSMDPSYDGFILADGTNCYLYGMDGDQIAVMEGGYAVEKGAYIQVSKGNNQYGLYDLEGNFLFDYDSDSGIRFVNDVILQEKGNTGYYAVLGRNGQPLTEYIFRFCQNPGVSGLMLEKIAGKGYFLVNRDGQFLNDVGYDEAPAISGSYCTYKIGGKTGIARIVYPGDDVFTDVPQGTWYYDYVEACAELELFNGTAPARFSPEDTMTRAMLVTVLWRLDGENKPENEADFVDVPNGIWYADAVAWASENGIVNGVGNGKFNPEDSVTREQIATILRRYAVSKGIDIHEQADLTSYPDAGEISSYAEEAMAWANGVGLINGNKMGNIILLQPKGNATRAQVAAILIRFLNYNT